MLGAETVAIQDRKRMLALLYRGLLYIGFLDIFITSKEDSLKVPERYERCVRISSSGKRISLPAPPDGREWTDSAVVIFSLEGLEILRQEKKEDK